MYPHDIKSFSSASSASDYHHGLGGYSQDSDYSNGQLKCFTHCSNTSHVGTVEHDNLRYIRFTDSPVTDITGLPELPAITCLVAVPDSVTPSIEYAFGPELEQSVLPVYPVPTLYVDTTLCTRSIADSFYQDSTAYASTTFWPAERVRLIGETRICDQRLLMIQLYPAQYRAADSTLSTVTSFRISVSWDSTEAVWSSVGMGEMQRIADGSPILGYSPREITYAQVPEYLGVVDAYNGPPSPDDRMPDYLIICASGFSITSR